MARQPAPINQNIAFSLTGWNQVVTAFNNLGNVGSNAFNRVATSAGRIPPPVNAATTSVARLNTGMNTLVTTTRRLIGLFGVVFGVREIIRTADSFTEMENKVQIATKSVEEFNDVMSKLRQISNETRTDVTANAQAFVRFNPVMALMGKTTDDTIRLIETLAKSLKNAGVSVQETGAGMRQLAQAFGRGALRGDEFISVAENLPPVAQAIAEQLNTTRGELFKFAETGQITSQVMEAALSSMAAAADRDFAGIRVTLGSAWQVMRNELGFLLNDFNKFTGIGRGVSTLLLLLADNLTTFAAALIPIGVALLAAFGPALLVHVNKLYLFLAKHPFVLIASAVAALVAHLFKMKEGGDTVAVIFERLRTIGTLLGQKLSEIGTVLVNFANSIAKAVGSSTAFEDVGDIIIAALDSIIRHFDLLFAAFATFAIAVGGAKIIGALHAFTTGIYAAATGVNLLNIGISANKLVILVSAAITAAYALGKLVRWWLDLDAVATKTVETLDQTKAGLDELGDTSNTNSNLDETADKIKKVKEEAEEPIPPLLIDFQVENPDAISQFASEAANEFVKFVETKKAKEKEYFDALAKFEEDHAKWRSEQMDEAQARDAEVAEQRSANSKDAQEELKQTTAEATKAGEAITEAVTLKPNVLTGWLNFFKSIYSAFEKAIKLAQALTDLLIKAIGLKAQAESGGSGGGGKAAGGPIGGAGRARGGPIWGAGTSTSDSNAYWLSRGEYVIRAAAVARYGMRVFDMLNSMRLPLDFFKGFKLGGLISPSQRFAGAGASAGSSGNGLVPWNLTIGAETFEGLLMPEHTASQMMRYSVGKQNTSNGKKPWWYS